MDRDVRFHQVVQDLRVIEARQCARRWILFHETYTIGFMGRARAGIADWRYRHRSFAVTTGRHVALGINPTRGRPAAEFGWIRGAESLADRHARGDD